MYHASVIEVDVTIANLRRCCIDILFYFLSYSRSALYEQNKEKVYPSLRHLQL